MLKYIKSKGLAIGANLHDALGVSAVEKRYADMAAANNVSVLDGSRLLNSSSMRVAGYRKSNCGVQNLAATVCGHVI